jgi:hypothetical protein
LALTSAWILVVSPRANAPCTRLERGPEPGLAWRGAPHFDIAAMMMDPDGGRSADATGGRVAGHAGRAIIRVIMITGTDDQDPPELMIRIKRIERS